jgi:hypothetical protein
LRDVHHTSAGALQYGEFKRGRLVMSKFIVLAALAFALATGTVIDLVTIAQSAQAACIDTTY